MGPLGSLTEVAPGADVCRLIAFLNIWHQVLVAALAALGQDVDMVNSVFAGTVVLAGIVDEKISVTDLERLVSLPRAGAVVSFVGAVRDHDHQRSVIDLEYQAHPSAGAVLEQVAKEVCGRHDVVALAVVHRAGSRLGTRRSWPS